MRVCSTCGIGPLTEGFFCDEEYWCNDDEPAEFAQWKKEAEETGDFECYWTTFEDDDE